MAAALVTVYITQYYTDYIHCPVCSIGQASVTGHATNIITGSADSSAKVWRLEGEDATKKPRARTQSGKEDPN